MTSHWVLIDVLPLNELSLVAQKCDSFVDLSLVAQKFDSLMCFHWLFTKCDSF